MNIDIINTIGIIGGFLFLFAFWRTSIGKWTGRSLWYELDNLFGATLMSIYAFRKGAFVNIALNLVWGVVAVRGVSSWAERRMHRQKLKAKRVKQRQLVHARTRTKRRRRILQEA